MLFTTAAHVIATLTKAHAKGRLDEKLKVFTTLRLLIIRPLHHAVTMNIHGNSYRLKDKLKAGLVRLHNDSSTKPGGEI